MTKKHKAAVSCLNSFSKFLISCSCEDNLILVYDYQRQEVDQEIRLPQDTFSGLPTVVNMFKDSATGADLLLIGTTSGKVLIYDLQLKQFGHEIRSKLVRTSGAHSRWSQAFEFVSSQSQSSKTCSLFPAMYSLSSLNVDKSSSLMLQSAQGRSRAGIGCSSKNWLSFKGTYQESKEKATRWESRSSW